MKKAEFVCPTCGKGIAVEVSEHITAYSEFERIDLDAKDSDGILEWYDTDTDFDNSTVTGYECNYCGLWLGATYDDIKKYFKEVTE